LLLGASTALADVVLLLSARGEAPTPALTSTLAHEARTVIIEVGHTLVTEVEMQSALRQVTDGTPDSVDEFSAMAKAANASWVVTPTIRPSAEGYHLELAAYWVPAGRTESVARDVHTPAPHQQVLEMARLLLRPEGIGTDALPWESKAPPPPPPGRDRPVSAFGTAPTRAAAEERLLDWKAGAGVGISTAVSRPDEAAGGATSVHGALRAAVELRRWEIGIDLRNAFTAPKAVSLNASVRAWFDIMPERGFRIAPELAPGLFFMRRGSKDTCFQLRVSLVAALDLAAHVSLEAQLGDASWMPASSGTLLLGGGTLLGVARF
jgi:hypothetical protein